MIGALKDLPVPFAGVLAVALRAMAVYLAAVFIVRIGKRRTLGSASPLDIILAFILGSMFSRSINGSAPLGPTLAGGLVIVLLHWIFAALGRRWPWWDRLINGRATLLVADGQVQKANLASAELSENDLHEALRLRGGVDDVSQVTEARLERNGRISVVTRSQGGQ